MVNDYADTNIADILNSVRQEIAQNRAEKNRSTNPVIEYQLDQQNTVNITDTVSRDGNTQSNTDTIALTDSVNRTSQATGTFVIDTALIDFSDVS